MEALPCWVAHGGDDGLHVKYPRKDRESSALHSAHSTATEPEPHPAGHTHNAICSCLCMVYDGACMLVSSHASTAISQNLALACSHASCNILAPKAYLIRRLRVVPCKKSDLRLVLGPDSAASAQVKGNTRVEYKPCVYGADWLPQCGCGSGGWEKLAGCSGRQGLG